MRGASARNPTFRYDDPMYRLFFRDLEIGTVQRTGGDFPWHWGCFDPTFLPEDSDLTRRIAEYIQISAKKYPLIEAEDFEPLHALEEQIAADFLDLIDTDDWRLIDGEDSWSITVPEFQEDQLIAWR